MQSSSHELDSPVADSVYRNLYRKIPYAEIDDRLVERYPIKVKSAGFRSKLEASHASTYTDELWYI